MKRWNWGATLGLWGNVAVVFAAVGVAISLTVIAGPFVIIIFFVGAVLGACMTIVGYE